MSVGALALRPVDAATRRWLAVLVVAGGAGALTARSTAVGLAVMGVGLFTILVILPPAVSIVGTPVVAVLYRLASPDAHGALGLAPDFLVAVVLAHALLAWVTAGSARGSVDGRVRKNVALGLGALAAVAISSALVHGGSLLGVLVSIRQFGRFPLWCLCVLYLGLSSTHVRYLVVAVLGAAFAQAPLAYYQFSGHAAAVPVSFHLERFDLVSGSFGIGGSGVLTVFLILVFVVWSSLALRKVIRTWLWLVGSTALILPMAWGSAASFVLLVPLSLVAVVLRFVLSRRVRLPWAAMIGGTIVVGVAVWSAQSFALAPGFGKGEIAASQLLSDRYLNEYVSRSSGADNSRLGFLLFALHTNDRSGASGVLLGQGPAAAVIGDSGTGEAGLSLSEFFAKAGHAAYSAQRLLLGYGFLGLLAFGLVATAVLTPSSPGPGQPPPWAEALWLAMPVVTFMFLLTGPYSAPWTEPGVAASYWALAAAAVLGRTGAESVS